MNRVYRIYLGARSTPSRTFSPRDNATVEGILNRYFKGWTIVAATGSWEGVSEESRVITVTTDPSAIQLGAGKTPIESCAKQLKGTLQQAAVMLEEGGLVTLYV